MIHAQEDISLLGQTLAVNFTTYLEDIIPTATMRVDVTYVSNGPAFRFSAEVPPITCSSTDLYWNFTLPELVAED